MTQPVSPEGALKACPFCGDDEELRVCQPLYLSGYWAVHCGCCGGEMQSESRAGAVADWNTRTDPPKTALDEIESALFDPIESDAVLNLESVVYDLEHGFKVDDGGVCVRSIKRVMMQLETARALLTHLKDRGQ